MSDEEVKILYIARGDHRIMCEKHQMRDSEPIEVSIAANCWKCLREID